MRAKELRVLNELDLETKVIELKKESMKINSQIAIGISPKNAHKVRQIKRTIARISTIKSEKQRGGSK